MATVGAWLFRVPKLFFLPNLESDFGLLTKIPAKMTTTIRNTNPMMTMDRGLSKANVFSSFELSKMVWEAVKDKVEDFKVFDGKGAEDAIL